MSVPKHLRRKGKFEVITNAEALVKYTLEITSNEKNFPKRYRWCLTSKIVDTTVEMFSDLVKANTIMVVKKEDYILRRHYQVKALSEIGSLLGLMQIAYDVFGIDSDRAEHWTRLVINEQAAIREWRDSDRERYKDVS
jgi:hypothetical protein